MLAEHAPTKQEAAAPRPVLDEGALRTLALEDGILAYSTPLHRVAFVGWVTMLVIASGFLAAVGVSVVLDAAGAAF